MASIKQYRKQLDELKDAELGDKVQATIADDCGEILSPMFICLMSAAADRLRARPGDDYLRKCAFCEELDELFDSMNEEMVEAIKLWQKETGKITSPEIGNLLRWLMERGNAKNRDNSSTER